MEESIPDGSYYILVVHPKHESVVGVNDRNLPLVSYRGSIGIRLDELCSFVRTNLNLPFDVVLLRSECGLLSDSQIGQKALLLFDVPEDQLPNASACGSSWKWIPKAEVQGMHLELGNGQVLDYLQKYSVHGLDVNSGRLRPFSKPGWFDKASKWTKDVLLDAGYKVCSIVQTKNNSASAIITTTCRCGTKFYLKAVRPNDSRHEVINTLCLAKNMPDLFMAPLAVEINMGFILMNDYGSSMPDDCDLANSEPELFRKILSSWAKVQIESISKKNDLRDLSVMDFASMKCQIEKMFEDPVWWTAQQEGMKESERNAYEESEYKERYLCHVETLCGKILEYQVPLALVHGDLNAVNCIARDDSSLLFIDFADTCWSFPFVDAAGFAFAHGADNAGLDFYLEFWTAYESLDRLKELLALADKVCEVNAVLSSYQMYSDAEECDRLQLRENMRSPVCRAFSKGLNV